MMQSINNKKSSVDYMILTILVALVIISVIAIYSGSGQYTNSDPYYFARRQLMWYIVSFGIMVAVARFDYELLEKWAIYLYIFGVMLLLYVKFFGVTTKGSQRWIDLKFMDFQPSEVMKIFIVLYLAAVLKKYGTEKLSFKKSIPVVLKTMVITLIPFYLILKQPDLGSALLIAVTALGILFISNTNYKMILLILFMMVAGSSLLFYLFNYHQELVAPYLESHQMGRINSWLNPSEYTLNYSYQVKNALVGIGSGQFTGAGFNQGYQVQTGRVPEAHTDFVFAVIGEEFGFVGSSIVILLYFLLIYRILSIALKANNVFGSYICVGVIILIAFQVFQNIGMTISLMPVTGIALPFISYGGSALITNMIALGLVQSINRGTKEYMFSSTQYE